MHSPRGVAAVTWIRSEPDGVITYTAVAASYVITKASDGWSLRRGRIDLGTFHLLEEAKAEADPPLPAA